MKKLYTALSGIALLLGAAQAEAQSYAPFQPNQTYHFSEANQATLYALKVDSVYTVGADSVFRLNRFAREVNFESYSQGSCNAQGIRFWLEESLFGEKMVKKPNGDFEFTTGNNQSFLLKTRVATGQSWPFYANSNVTATLSSKGVETVHQSVTDSVLTYTLSDGKTIKLSKNYGLLEIPSLKAYYHANTPSKNWNFFALPEKNIGQNTLNSLTIHNYEVGDSIGWKYSEEKSSSVCLERWIRHVILDKTVSTTQDTVYHTIQRQVVTRSNGSPNAPAQFCQGTSGTSGIATDTITEMYTINDNTAANLRPHGFIKDNSFRSSASRGTSFNTTHNRYVTSVQESGLEPVTCTNALKQIPDVGTNTIYLEGVGVLLSTSSGVYDFTKKELEFYRKANNQNFGTYSPLRLIASAKEKLFTEAPAAYPNPFTQELTLQFNSPKSLENLELTVYNQLGQQVYKTKTDIAQGQQQLQLPLQSLTTGMYLVKMSQGAVSETIKIIKQ